MSATTMPTTKQAMLMWPSRHNDVSIHITQMEKRCRQTTCKWRNDAGKQRARNQHDRSDIKLIRVYAGKCEEVNHHFLLRKSFTDSSVLASLCHKSPQFFPKSTATKNVHYYKMMAGDCRMLSASYILEKHKCSEFPTPWLVSASKHVTLRITWPLHPVTSG